MAVILDTTSLPPGERTEAVRQMGLTGTPMEVKYHCPQEHIVDVFEMWQLGDTKIIRTEGAARTVWQTDRQARESPHEIGLFTLKLRGRATSTQSSVTVEETPGSLRMTDLSRSYEYREVESGSIIAVLVDFDRLSLPMDLVHKVSTVLHCSALYPLVRHHLLQLCTDNTDTIGPSARAMLATATTELLRALIVSAAGNDLDVDNTWNETLRTRIIAYIGQHLTDPDLCPDKIAAHHNISMRTLYNAWSRNKVTLGEWIIRERLEGARHELATWGPNGPTVTVLAHRWGFADSTHFSRRFRRAYGMSPREWRQLHRGLPTTLLDRAMSVESGFADSSDAESSAN
jgi:AraC-like DNA-binding protein